MASPARIHVAATYPVNTRNKRLPGAVIGSAYGTCAQHFNQGSNIHSP
ncbi:MAG: hypothetical protein ABIO21_10105 [Pseudomonas sp.]